jgi:hypothetical protein
MSSKRPTNGEMYDAPERAANIACGTVKHRVMFTLMPRSDSALVAASPSGMVGTLTMRFGAMSASSMPSRMISSRCKPTVSPLTGPSTMSQIRFR